MISIFGAVFVVVFLIALTTIVSGFWRMRGMANKVFTLAEQEIERKLREGPTKTSDATLDQKMCSHCGRRLAANVAQCPNCGAGLP